jgi:hypothetical protein
MQIDDLPCHLQAKLVEQPRTTLRPEEEKPSREKKHWDQIQNMELLKPICS